MIKSGIYKITSPSNRVYIGQSSNLENRRKDYLKQINKNQIRLYRSFLKYGFEKHTFEIIEFCDFQDLNRRERYWQDTYDVLSLKGLNCKLTETDKEKFYLSAETRKNMSDAQKGKKRAKDSVEKGLKTKKERGLNFHSDVTKNKMKEAALKRDTLTDETRKKLSESHIGKTISSESTKKRINTRKEKGWYKDREAFSKKMSDIRKQQSINLKKLKINLE